ncbi:MAG: hypothetical protein HY220_02365 [Candidatus Sungbacteria bacterium]|uniref:Uncharacterized protein n=1 Tax=Candidatus Sungiibacteriota bacterium TaxID=2750080 RepID=A0A9D6LPW8_9BACT|nr:hypothetical protein [Candidatus Sungbacteria bacterium]
MEIMDNPGDGFSILDTGRIDEMSLKQFEKAFDEELEPLERELLRRDLRPKAA